MKKKTYLLGTTLMLAMCLGTAQAQASSTIYTQDFSGNTNGFTGTGVAAVTPSGEHYLELANGNTGTLTVNTAGFTGLTLAFDLYGLQSVDGNAGGSDADNFFIYLNGSTTPAYNINVSNVNFNSQDFNGDLSQSGPGSVYGPRTGATAIGTLGYGNNSFFGPQDSTYHISFMLPSSDFSTISFVGATNEEATNPNGLPAGNEAYGIDNVVLSGSGNPVAAVPEPASWAMMIMGFGMIGAGIRYRQRRTMLHYI